MLTIAAVAEHKKIPLSRLKVDITRASNPEKEEGVAFEIAIELPPALKEREKVLLFNAARRCDVTKILSGEMDFSYKLIDK